MRQRNLVSVDANFSVREANILYFQMAFHVVPRVHMSDNPGYCTTGVVIL